MEKYIGIIGAMDEEVSALIQHLTDPEPIAAPFRDLPVFKGRLGDRSVIIARCGIGKVNAALCSQFMIDRFPLQVLINTGVAGGISPLLELGDLVISANAIHHDFDTRNFGYDRGTIPSMNVRSFPADPQIQKEALQIAKHIMGAERVHLGLVVSGDQFVSSTDQKNEIVQFFPDALCVEMEGAAIAQAAYVNRIPYVIIRSISDKADNTAPDDFDAYLDKVIPKLNEVVRELVSTI